VLIVVCYPIAWPVGSLLNFLLGSDDQSHYKRNQLRAIVDLHAEAAGSDDKSPTSSGGVPPAVLSADEQLVMKGAMELRDKKVSDAMKPLDEVFMISADAPLNQDVIDRIIATGHSRIPIYRDTRGNIEEVLLTKTLLRLLPKIMSNPLVQLEEKVGDLDTQYELLLLRDDLSLYEALEEFQQRRRHLAVVVAHDSKKQLGIITLEDVIEELLQEELFDETDINEAGVMAITVESPHVVSRAAGLANFVRMQSSPRSPGKISRAHSLTKRGVTVLDTTAVRISTNSVARSRSVGNSSQPPSNDKTPLL